MLILDQLRKVAPKFSGASDKELEAVRQALYAMAQLAYEVRHGGRGGSKNPVGLFPAQDEASTLSLWSKGSEQE